MGKHAAETATRHRPYGIAVTGQMDRHERVRRRAARRMGGRVKPSRLPSRRCAKPEKPGPHGHAVVLCLILDLSALRGSLDSHHTCCVFSGTWRLGHDAPAPPPLHSPGREPRTPECCTPRAPRPYACGGVRGIQGWRWGTSRVNLGSRATIRGCGHQEDWGRVNARWVSRPGQGDCA